MTAFDAIESLVARGKKIEAIKEFRARTGAGLREAKDAVEWFQAHGQWPPQYLGEPEAARPSGGGLDASAPGLEPSDGRLAELERLMASEQKISAIKRIRELTGWGLLQSKQATDHYQDHGSWGADLLAVLGGPRAAPVAAPAPAPSPAPASTPPGHGQTAMLQALASHFGYAPDVLLTAPARRVASDGWLVVLRGHTCFLGEDRGRWMVDPVLSHEAVVHVEVHHGLRAVLYVSLGYLHERFELDPAHADAALALLRVFGR